jgi:hypothetical protein
MDRDELERRCAAFSGAVLTFCSLLRGQGGGSEIAHQLQRAAAAVPAITAPRAARAREESSSRSWESCAKKSMKPCTGSSSSAMRS